MAQRSVGKICHVITQKHIFKTFCGGMGCYWHNSRNKVNSIVFLMYPAFFCLYTNDGTVSCDVTVTFILKGTFSNCQYPLILLYLLCKCSWNKFKKNCTPRTTIPQSCLHPFCTFVSHFCIFVTTV